MEFLHLVFAVVTARTEMAALAKGTAAHSLLAKKGDTAITETELVADNDGSPSRTLTEQWGDLPGVAQLESDAGERLLQQASIEQWAGQPIWECKVCEMPRYGLAPA
ncbi:hypothetical protein [Halarchaeum grantii]|nr:hypothetical protein [Halarchaeum grantii]